jgi:CRISPR-associated exonuclease Cas4
MFEEDDLLPLSALQHYLFCDRQAGLIHLDRIWVDNALTVEGKHLHESVDSMQPESKRGILIRRGLMIRSFRLGVTGKADVVEFEPVDGPDPGCTLPSLDGRWRLIPVEYKRGRPKSHRADEVQLCAQAMCLEEEFQTEVRFGFLFYGRTRRRERVGFDQELRALTEEAAIGLHRMVRSRSVPVRPLQAKCSRCSLVHACLPPSRAARRSARRYLDGILDEGTTNREPT